MRTPLATHVSAAPAQLADIGVDVSVARPGVTIEKIHVGHDHAGLTVDQERNHEVASELISQVPVCTCIYDASWRNKQDKNRSLQRYIQWLA
jgi:hypothetical protein